MLVDFRAGTKPVRQPVGAKLQIIAMHDPKWIRDLEKLVDWKLTQIKKVE